LGNTVLSQVSRRSADSTNWEAFKQNMLPTVIKGELTQYLQSFEEWDSDAIASAGEHVAGLAGDVWYS
jgi:hypothetical protein